MNITGPKIFSFKPEDAAPLTTVELQRDFAVEKALMKIPDTIVKHIKVQIEILNNPDKLYNQRIRVFFFKFPAFYQSQVRVFQEENQTTFNVMPDLAEEFKKLDFFVTSVGFAPDSRITSEIKFKVNLLRR